MIATNIHRKRANLIVQALKKLFPVPKTALVYSNPWEFLVAVILSAQCTDVRVNIVTKKLFVKYPTLDNYVKADSIEFEQDIKSTGYYRNKAKNILATAKIIKHQYNGELPRTMESMMKLPGVARKTANVVLANEFGIIEGIAVDTHVRRLSRLYGLTAEMSPEKIERDLMELLPREEWRDFTLRMIDYGRKYCPAKKHTHELCPLVMALKESKLYPEDPLL